MSKKRQLTGDEQKATKVIKHEQPYVNLLVENAVGIPERSCRLWKKENAVDSLSSLKYVKAGGNQMV